MLPLYCSRRHNSPGARRVFEIFVTKRLFADCHCGFGSQGFLTLGLFLRARGVAGAPPRSIQKRCVSTTVLKVGHLMVSNQFHYARP